jgi:hypothetical protein
MVTYIRVAWKLVQSGEFNHSSVARDYSFVTVEEKTLVVQQGMERVVDSH